MDWYTLSSLRALKVWKLTSFYVIFSVSQTLKHPLLTSGWISCLYIHLQRTLCQVGCMYILLNAQALKLLKIEL
jgi:hypothetical protein